MKRILAFALCIMLLLSVLPTAAIAVSNEEDAALRQQISRIFWRSLNASGKDSLSGYCGAMTAWQLYFLGIDKYLNMYNGKDEYDAYRGLQVTTGGYAVQIFDAQYYTMEQALHTITQGGTRNAYNIMMGFERTTTTNGSIYGHALVIHAIVDNMVYFVEGFYTEIGGSAGTPIVCTIDEFVGVYDYWTEFEGAVVFGTKAYLDFCSKYASALIVEAVTDTALYSIPATSNMMEEECRVYRTVLKNERLNVTNLYRNPNGEVFYEVDNDGVLAYVKAEDTQVVLLHMDTVRGEELIAPETLQPGENFSLGGEVFTSEGSFTGLQLQITDSTGAVVQEKLVPGNGNMIAIPENALDFSKLEEGAYTYSVNANVKSYYLNNGEIAVMEDSTCVSFSTFTVGDSVVNDEEDNNGSLVLNGWVHDQNTWFFYKNGEPQVGWICYNGVDYYLKEDGSITVGWKNINGYDRYFSNTGAMRTGWLEAEQGTYFMLSNGVAARGLRNIDGKLYYFGKNGLMQTNDEVTVNGVNYILQADGQAIAQ